jgi:hypothetical protein
MDVMVKFILALLLAFLTVSGPLHAQCYYENPAAESCCCARPDVNCVQLSGSCCGTTGEAPALPAPNSAETPHAPVAAAPQPWSLSVDQVSVVELAVDVENRKPLHLASNKLYLLKRRLLI